MQHTLAVSRLTGACLHTTPIHPCMNASDDEQQHCHVKNKTHKSNCEANETMYIMEAATVEIAGESKNTMCLCVHVMRLVKLSSVR